MLDATAVAQLPVTVIDEVGELEHELSDRGVALWIAALHPTRGPPPY